MCLSLTTQASADELPESSGWNFGGYTTVESDLHSDGHFDMGWQNLSLITKYEGEQRLRFFNEIELEKPLLWESGHSLTVKKSSLSLERLYIDYNLNENFNARLGRFLNPVGHWNLIHADPLVWTTTRPLVTTRLFPQSTNGVMIFGARSFNDQLLEYSAYAEISKNEDENRNLGDAEGTKGLSLDWTDNGTFGVSYLEFTEHRPEDTKYHLLGVDFRKKIGDIEVSSEAFQRVTSKGRNGGNGAYVQIVYPVVSKSYVVARLDTVEVPREYSVSRYVLGYAYKSSVNKIFKIEYSGGSSETSIAPKGLIASYSILF
jgi:hypothetical protein